MIALGDRPGYQTDVAKYYMEKLKDKKKEYFKKYIQEQKQKDRLKQNINLLREKLQTKKRKYD